MWLWRILQQRLSWRGFYEFLTDKIRPIYFKYLAAAFGSALISSIYGLVDTAMVGQYQGPTGTAALAVVAPIWNIIYSLGLLTGIGGSVLFSTLRGESPDNEKKSNEYYTAAILGTSVLGLLAWAAVILSVYGIIINISTFVQCCAYSIGQASQPIISVNYGAGQKDRIGEVLKYALGTAAVFGILWTGAAELIPNVFVRIFMTPTDSILRIAPGIIRSYGISFILLPFNIFSTYYFQAMMKPSTAFVVSVGRGAVISGILIYLMPLVAGASSIWFAMPITELVVAIYVAWMMKRCQTRPAAV